MKAPIGVRVADKITECIKTPQDLIELTKEGKSIQDNY
jgi:hypothetical protein